MNKENVLILIETDPDLDIFFKDWIKNGYQASVLFKKVNKPLRALRRIWLMNNLPCSSKWLGGWFNKLNSYESVIIHMNRLTLHIPELVTKKYPKIKVIGWYWNTIAKDSIPIKSNNSNIEYWTFDENDSIKYGLKKNIQYYCPVEITNQSRDIDLYYIGRKRNRENKINDIKNLAFKNDLNIDFKVIDDNSEDIVPYSEVKKKLERSKCILEINKVNQVGFTLRTLESLFYETKLITDNKAIKKAPFYRKENIYIIDDNDTRNIKDFINSSYDHGVDKYKKNYCLDRWFNNFYEKD